MAKTKNSKIKIKPLSDRVVIAPVFLNEKKTKSALYIPETNSKEKPETGKVIAVGEGRISENGTRVKMTVKVGDIVLFSKYTPDEIKLNEENLIILREDQILGIIN